MTSARWTRGARLVFWAAAAFTLVMALLPHPPRLPGAPSDKIQHIMAFATLAGLASVAYPRATLRTALGLALFGAAIEVLQTIPGLNRDGNVVDWLADVAAALAVLGAARAVRAARRGR